MADADLEEYKRLEGVVASLEKLQAGSPQGTSPLLSAFIDGVKKQLENLDHKIKEKEKTTELEKQTAIQVAVDRETALNASEKETYGGFLKEDFFTKADFGRLQSFYDKSWDKLSESGKDEMSHRVWEGIRHGEYDFESLPDTLKRKEAERVHKQLTEGLELNSNLDRIPLVDKQDFLERYGSNNREEAYKVLTRDSFRNNIFVQESHDTDRAAASRVTDREGKAVLPPTLEANATSRKAETTPKSEEKGNADISLDSVNLTGLTLSESEDVNKPDIPQLKNKSGTVRTTV